MGDNVGFILLAVTILAFLLIVMMFPGIVESGRQSECLARGGSWIGPDNCIQLGAP